MTNIKFEDIKGQKDNLARVMDAMKHNLPTLLVGLTGTGKTSLAYACANKLGKTVTRINLTGQTFEDELAGKMGLLNGQTYFIEGPLTKALREGHVLILDEVNAANAEVLFLLHPLLDDGRFIRLMGKDGEIVNAHPDFRLFATMNPPEYVGTKELNPAFLSRFQMILNVEYPRPTDEAKILMERCAGLPETSIAAMVELANVSRKAFNSGEMLSVVSTRDLISWGNLSVILGSHTKAFEPCVLNRCVQSQADREYLKKESVRVFKDTAKELADIEKPISIILNAQQVRAEQEANLQKMAAGLKALEEKEKALAKYAVEAVSKLVDDAKAVVGNGKAKSPVAAVTEAVAANEDKATNDEQITDTIRKYMREGKSPMQIGSGSPHSLTPPLVDRHYTTIYTLIRNHGGKDAFLSAKDLAKAVAKDDVTLKGRPPIMEMVGEDSSGAAICAFRPMTDAELIEHNLTPSEYQPVEIPTNKKKEKVVF